jgi:mRNA interferase MazF
VKRGDIVWVEFVSRGGREQAGRRPAIIWQSEDACRALPTVLVIPLTSQLSALRFPGTVLIEKSEDNKLRQNSVALLFQLTAADKNRLQEILGTLSSDDSDKLQTAWAELTDTASPKEEAT